MGIGMGRDQRRIRQTGDIVKALFVQVRKINQNAQRVAFRNQPPPRLGRAEIAYSFPTMRPGLPEDCELIEVRIVQAEPPAMIDQPAVAAAHRPTHARPKPPYTVVAAREWLQLRVATWPRGDAPSTASQCLADAQDQAYRESVLPTAVTARVACEAACGFGWDKWIGPRGTFIGMNSFGASGPAPALYKHFGITADAVAAAAKSLVAG